MAAEQRKPTHEEQLEMSEAINLALDAYQGAAYHYGCTIMGLSTSREQRDEAMRAMLDARDAVVIAIAARVKESREAGR